MSNREQEFLNSIQWSEEYIQIIKKDVEKIKGIENNLFFAHKSKEILGIDKGTKFLNLVHEMYKSLGHISIKHKDETNLNYLSIAAEAWNKLEKPFGDIVFHCQRGGDAPYKGKMMRFIKELKRVSSHLGDTEALAQKRLHWFLNGLFSIPLALIIIAGVVVAVIEFT